MRSFKTFLEENKGPCWKKYRQVPNCVPEEVELDEMFNKVHPTLKKELGIHGSHAVGMAASDKGVAVQFDRPKNTSELMKQMSKHGYKNVTAVGNQKNTYHFNEEVELEEMFNKSNPKLKEELQFNEHTQCGTPDCCGKCDTAILEGSESWEAGYKRRVVKTTDPEHKEKGMNWRIKGKDRPEISIKLYKEKPSQAEFNKQMKRVAGHEFGG